MLTFVIYSKMKYLMAFLNFHLQARLYFAGLFSFQAWNQRLFTHWKLKSITETCRYKYLLVYLVQEKQDASCTAGIYSFVCLLWKVGFVLIKFMSVEVLSQFLKWTCRVEYNTWILTSFSSINLPLRYFKTCNQQ